MNSFTITPNCTSIGDVEVKPALLPVALKCSLIFALSAFAIFWLWQYPLYYNIDAALFLQAGDLLLAGKLPYVDFMVINPPLIVYLNLIPAYLSRTTSIAPTLVFEILVILFAVSSTLTLARLDALSTKSRLPKSSIFSLMIYLVFSCFTRQFGQREELFIFAFMPYFFLRWLEVADDLRFPRMHSVIVFGCSALACLKPHFFIMIVAYELALYWLKRKPVPWLPLALAPLLYAVHFCFLPVAMLRAFWYEHIPLVSERYYTFGATWQQQIMHVRQYLYAAIFVGPFLEVGRRRNRMLFTIGLVAMAGVCVGLAQNRGFPYHFLPMHAIIMFGLPILYREVSGALNKSSVVIAATLVFVNTILNLDFTTAETKFVELLNASQAEAADLIAGAAKPGQKIILFTPTIAYLYPAIALHGLQSGSRYLSFYPLAFFNNTAERNQLLQSHYPRRDEMDRREMTFIDRVVTDIRLNKPELLIIPTKEIPALYTPLNFDPFAYFVSSGIYEQVKSHYRLELSSHNFKVLTYHN